jgi:hypothetical protein
MRDEKRLFVVYVRVSATEPDAEVSDILQLARGRAEASREGGRVVGEYIDRSDGVQPGPNLERLLADMAKNRWQQPIVVVERLSRVSRDIDVLRFITCRIHDLGGELLSCRERGATVLTNPRVPASIGQTMFLDPKAAIAAATRFGATCASHIRVECPVHFSGLCGMVQREELRGPKAIDKIVHEPEKLPSARDGIEMLKWLGDGEVSGSELENAFVEGFVGELQLHIRVRGGP